MVGNISEMGNNTVFVKQALLLRFRRAGLCPHGDDDGIGGVARFEEYDGDVASGDHFSSGDTSVHWYVLKPYRQATLDLYGCGIGGAIEGLEDSFYYHV